MTTQHTDALRDGATVDAMVAAAFRDGRDTARACARRVNPFDGLAESSVERVRSVMWARGYSAGNRMRLRTAE